MAVGGEYRAGLVLSAAVHVGVVVAALVGLPSLTRDSPDLPEVVPVDFVVIAEEARTTEPQPQSQPEPTPEPERQVAQVEPKPAPAPEAVPLPAERPEAPTPPPEPEPKPEPDPEPQARIVVTPRAKPRPPSRFHANRLAALIDRSIEETAPTPSEPADEEAEPQQTDKPDEPQRRQAALTDRFATTTLRALIADRVQKCWYLPAGAKDVADMQVTIRIDLRRDGRLARQPRFVDTGEHSLSGNEFYRIFAESARRAVQNCEPYEDLPSAQYHIWQSIEFTFDAGRMLGG